MSAYRTLVVLVRPTSFFANPVTMQDNHFQHAGDDSAKDSAAAQSEHAELGVALAKHGVAVSLVPSEYDGVTHRPDAIFPNNSLSFHVTPSPVAGEPDILTAFLYPMSPGRRLEVPPPLLKGLEALAAADGGRAFRLIDLRNFEKPDTAAAVGLSVAAEEAPNGLVLEGTGALVFSHDGAAVYMGESQRAYAALLAHLAASVDAAAPFRSPALREMHLFKAADRNGRRVYHTNVVGWVGVKVAAWCFDAMSFEGGDAVDVNGVKVHRTREAFDESFRARGVTVLTLTMDEMDGFAGNALELFDDHGRPVLTLSAVAWANLSPSNKAALIAAYTEECIVPAPIPTIERLGGGSVRCLQCHLNYRVDENGAAVAPAVDKVKTLLQSLNAL